ncbi:MAG: NUDIX domain-containing protein [Candidatus Taylorbacteria bacterium]
MNEKFPKGIEIVGSAVIENDVGKILIVESPKWPGKWTLPGGHVEPGETIIEGIVREGEEETGLRLRGKYVFDWGELIGSTDFHRSAHFVWFHVWCEIVGGELNLDGVELISSRWVSPEEAFTFPLAEGYKKSVQKFIAFKKSQSVDF